MLRLLRPGVKTGRVDGEEEVRVWWEGGRGRFKVSELRVWVCRYRGIEMKTAANRNSF